MTAAPDRAHGVTAGQLGISGRGDEMWSMVSRQPHLFRLLCSSVYRRWLYANITPTKRPIQRVIGLNFPERANPEGSGMTVAFASEKQSMENQTFNPQARHRVGPRSCGF